MTAPTIEAVREAATAATAAYVQSPAFVATITAAVRAELDRPSTVANEAVQAKLQTNGMFYRDLDDLVYAAFGDYLSESWTELTRPQQAELHDLIEQAEARARAEAASIIEAAIAEVAETFGQRYPDAHRPAAEATA